MMLITTPKNFDIEIYEFVQYFVTTEYNHVSADDQLDLIHDTFLYMHDVSLRNKDSKAFKYYAYQYTKRFCDKWIQTHKEHFASLNDVSLILENPELYVIKTNMCKEIIEMADTTPREDLVVKYRVFDKRFFEDIGNELGISRARAQQIYVSALRKYRIACCNMGIELFELI